MFSLAVFTIGTISVFCDEIFTSFENFSVQKVENFLLLYFRILLADSKRFFTFVFSGLASATEATESIAFFISSFC
jgi:hypothetical protein